MFPFKRIKNKLANRMKDKLLQEFYSKRLVLYQLEAIWDLEIHSEISTWMMDQPKIPDAHLISYYQSITSYPYFSPTYRPQYELFYPLLEKFYKDYKDYKFQQIYVDLYKYAIKAAIAIGKHDNIKEWHSIVKKYYDYGRDTKKQQEHFISLIGDFLSGELNKKVVEILAHCISLKESGKAIRLKNYELEILMLIKAKAFFLDKLFQNKTTGEAWMIDESYDIFYFNGEEFMDDPLQLKLISSLDTPVQIDLIGTKQLCDKSWLFWSGKFVYHFIQQYGSKFIVYKSIHVGNGRGAMIRFIAIGSIKETYHMEEVVNFYTETLSKSTKQINPYFCPEKGFILRQHEWNQNKDGGLTVYKNHWVKIGHEEIPRIAKSFKNHEEAVTEFEKRSTKLTKQGLPIKNFELFEDVDKIIELDND